MVLIHIYCLYYNKRYDELLTYKTILVDFEESGSQF